MRNVWEILRPILVLTLICAVITAALAGTNALTAGNIAAAEQAAQEAAMAELVPGADFLPETGLLQGEAFEYHAASFGGRITHYLFLTSAVGYGGDVSVMTAIDAGTGSVSGIQIVAADDETPSLGQNWTTDKADLAQFQGASGEVKVTKDGGEIQAVTSATMTSRAVCEAVNLALARYREVTV